MERTPGVKETFLADLKEVDFPVTTPHARNKLRRITKVRSVAIGVGAVAGGIIDRIYGSFPLGILAGAAATDLAMVAAAARIKKFNTWIKKDPLTRPRD